MQLTSNSVGNNSLDMVPQPSLQRPEQLQQSLHERINQDVFDDWTDAPKTFNTKQYGATGKSLLTRWTFMSSHIKKTV
jgi:hypothetical protein